MIEFYAKCDVCHVSEQIDGPGVLPKGWSVVRFTELLEPSHYCEGCTDVARQAANESYFAKLRERHKAAEATQ
jgi:hypothetical protein